VGGVAGALTSARSAGARALGFVRSEPLLVLAVAFAAAAYSLIAVQLYLRFENGYDLAIFDQAVWHLSRFEYPETTLVVDDAAQRIPLDSIWGDHFHPVLLLLAPLYWVWADPRVLLVAQALLVASSAVPIFLFARLHLPRLAAYLATFAYLAYWALHTGVGFAFHEVAFAPLPIALAIYFAGSGRFGAALAAALATLAVREDLAIFMIAFGVYLLLLRRVREGGVALAAGTAWFVLTTQVLLPLFAGGDRGFRHFRYAQFGDSMPDALSTAVRDPTLVFVVATEPPAKAQLVLFLFAPFLFLALYSPLIVLAVPLIAARVLSSKASFWSPHLHYSLTVAPVIAAASIEGLRNVLRALGVVRRFDLAAAVVAAALVLASVGIAKNYTGRRLFERSLYETTQSERDAAAAVAAVPRHTGSVLTQPELVARLSERSDIYLIAAEAPDAEYIVWKRSGGRFSSPSQIAVEQRVLRERRPRYTRIIERGDYEVLRRR
jgi:uncharacterized membrane protein